MPNTRATLADAAASLLGSLVTPGLRFIARHRLLLPRFQKLADRHGFQIRSIHYYEPTYAESDLPLITTGERALPGVFMNGPAQMALLAEFNFAEELRAIPLDKPCPNAFGYRNNMYSFGDAELLYNMIRLKKPHNIIEVGCGNSTLIGLLAIAANKRDDKEYSCHYTCIEPYEVPWLESTGVTVLRKKVEDIDLSVFTVLQPNDILFIDSSHVIRPYGDVLYELHQIIPNMAAGVLIHIDDIFTPRDYPEKWLRQQRRLWNEQYLLESFLAFNTEYEIICASNWLANNHAEAFLRACPMMVHKPGHQPGAFWIRRIKNDHIAHP